MGLEFNTSTGVLSGQIVHGKQTEFTIYATSKLYRSKTSKKIIIDIPKAAPSTITINGVGQLDSSGVVNQTYTLIQGPEASDEVNAISDII
jgi:hypothetical protein